MVERWSQVWRPMDSRWKEREKGRKVSSTRARRGGTDGKMRGTNVVLLDGRSVGFLLQKDVSPMVPKKNDQRRQSFRKKERTKTHQVISKVDAARRMGDE